MSACVCGNFECSNDPRPKYRSRSVLPTRSKQDVTRRATPHNDVTLDSAGSNTIRFQTKIKNSILNSGASAIKIK